MEKRLYAFLLLIILNADIIYSQTPVLQFTINSDRITGEWDCYFGPAGDVNHDGFDDFLVTENGGVRVRLYLGGTTFSSSRYITLVGDTLHSHHFGCSYSGAPLSGIGDINGDGYDDFAIGEYDWGDGFSFPGRVFVYYGGNEINDKPAVILTGGNPKGSFGEIISPAGDVNHDGYADFLVTDNIDPRVAPRTVVLVLGGTDVDHMQTIVLRKGWGSNYFGESLAGVGDIDGDGYDDFVIGEPGVLEINKPKITASNIYIYYGGAEIDTSRYIKIHHDNEALFGRYISKAGDLNGDGKPDFLVYEESYKYIFTGAYQYEKIYYPGFFDGGYDMNKDGYMDFLMCNYNLTNGNWRIDGYFGRTQFDTIPDFRIEGNTDKNNVPLKLKFIGDINGDGYPEFMTSLRQQGKLNIYSIGNVVGVERDNGEIPKGYNLFQNYPNPFNPETKIEFEIPKQERVILKIFDPLGREIKTIAAGIYNRGRYYINFNSLGLSSGIYYYQLKAGLFEKTKKMVVVK
jgi:hypothetical protein